MARPIVQVDGARQLRRTLRAAGEDVTQLKDVHREAAGIVDGRAKPSAPRRSGKLASTERTGATQTASILRAGKKRVPYAGPIHFGWRKRGIRPQPWITTAAQETEPLWTARFKQRVDEIIDSIKGTHQ